MRNKNDVYMYIKCINANTRKSDINTRQDRELYN